MKHSKIKNIKPFLLILTIAAFSVHGGQVDRASLWCGDNMSHAFSDKIHQQIWESKQWQAKEGEVQINLGYFRDLANSNAEIRVVVRAEGQEYVLWRTIVEDATCLPREYDLAISDDNEKIGLCLEYSPRPLLFYEINIRQAIENAKVNGGLVLPTYIYFLPLKEVPSAVETNNSVDEMDVDELLKFKPILVDERKIQKLELRFVSNQWEFSGIINGHHISETKIYFQHPISGAGFTLLKKEVLPQETEVNPEKVIKWRIALAVMFLLVAVPTFFVVRKIGRQKTAAATKP